MSAIITPESPDSADAVVLIAELEAHLEPLYPKKSRHGYSVEQLLCVHSFVDQDSGSCCSIIWRTMLEPMASACFG
jgi:hypothetical protein